MSFFGEVEQAPVVEVFALSHACEDDNAAIKVNLTVGAYRNNEGKPWVLPCVRSAEQSLAADKELNKEYLPITGLRSLCTEGMKVLLGEDDALMVTKKADNCQTLGGTGAIYLALQFLKNVAKFTTVYASNPTWPNHKSIAKSVGLNLKEYRYWDSDSRAVDFDGMMDDLSKAPECAVVILHACAHNPTGMDLSKEQWMKLSTLIKERRLFPLFDIAYQGFASGDLENDAWSVRYFASQGHEMFIAQSFSKNFGLYNERIGTLIFITNDPLITSRVKSQLTLLIRRCWSNPPQHGARIVSTILSTPALRAEWISDVSSMAGRIKDMRRSLYEHLRVLNTPGSWEHILNQIGMFSYSGLTRKQVAYLREKHHIYLMNDGRINICGLTTHNIEYISNAIHDAVLKITE